MPKLTLCVIVKDEAAFLRRCLDSYRQYVERIIVTDTGSTDNSPAVAESVGAQVIRFPWNGSFSDARNTGLAAADTPWIVWSDADDVLEPHEGEKLRYLADTRDADTAYGFVIKNTVDGALGPEFYQVRMFPRYSFLRFEYRIHEQILPCIIRENIPYRMTDIRVLHTGYSTPEVRRAKQERNLSAMELEVSERRDDPAFLLCYASALLATGRQAEGKHALRGILRLHEVPDHLRLAAKLTLSELLMSIHPEEARDLASAALHLSPGHPHAHLLLALSLLPTSPALAIPHLRACIESQAPTTQAPCDPTTLKLTAIQHLATIYASMPEYHSLVKTLYNQARKLSGRG